MPPGNFLRIRLLRACVLGLVLLLFTMTGLRAGPPSSAGAPRALRVSAVEISGVWKTREAVILHLLGLEAGDVLSPETLLQGRRRLLRSGFFSEVEISSRAGEALGEVVLELRLQERHQPYLDTGFGYRDTGGWYLNLLSLRSENTLGLGGRSTFGAQLGFRTAGLALESRLPLRADASLALRLRLSGRSEERLWYEEEPGWDDLFDEYRLGLSRSEGEISLEWRPIRLLRLNAGIEGLSVEPKDEGVNRDTGDRLPLADLPAPIVAESEKQSLHGLVLGLRLGEGGMDGRPGQSLHLSGRLVAKSLGAGRDFHRWTLALRTSHRVIGEQEFAFGLRAGHIWGDAPWFERFHIGGSYSLRGFRDHSLSPLSGHSSYWVASGEYRLPLTATRRTRLGGVLFVDAGRGSGLLDGYETEIDYEAPQMGFGYGLRFEVPWMGILGFDVGFPATRGVTGESVWYYLTLGHSF